LGKLKKIYEDLKKAKKFEGVNKNLLHSRFIRRDRKDKEEKFGNGKKDSSEKGFG
jgi:CRISPR/Cas system-associated endonuclease/helicase Cas3